MTLLSVKVAPLAGLQPSGWRQASRLRQLNVPGNGQDALGLHAGSESSVKVPAAHARAQTHLFWGDNERARALA